LRNRNIIINFRLNQKESDHLRKLVKKSGLSQEAYLRQLINGLVPRDLPPPDYFAMMQSLYDVGAVLGEIAQKARALGEIDAAHYEHRRLPSHRLFRAATGT